MLYCFGLAARRLAAAREKASKELTRVKRILQTIDGAQRSAGIPLQWNLDKARERLAQAGDVNRMEYGMAVAWATDARELSAEGIEKVTRELEGFLAQQHLKVSRHTADLQRARDAHAQEAAKIEAQFYWEEASSRRMQRIPARPKSLSTSQRRTT